MPHGDKVCVCGLGLGMSDLIGIADLVDPPAFPFLRLDTQVLAGDRLQDRQARVVAEIDPGVGRFDILHVHGEPLLQVLVGLAKRARVPGRSHRSRWTAAVWATIHLPQDNPGL